MGFHTRGSQSGRIRRLVLVDGSQGGVVDSELARSRSAVDRTTNDSFRKFSWDKAVSEVSADDIRVPIIELDVEVRDPQLNSVEIREALTSRDAVDLMIARAEPW